jgi:hypothetical protein
LFSKFDGDGATLITLRNFAKYMFQQASIEELPSTWHYMDLRFTHASLFDDVGADNTLDGQVDFAQILNEWGSKYRSVAFQPALHGQFWTTSPDGMSSLHALFDGRRLWALYPPGKTVPGSTGSLFNDGVASPGDQHVQESIFEWYENTLPFLDEKPIFGIQEAGEVMSVPAGWSFSTLNLEPVIGFSQAGCNSRSIKSCISHFCEKFPNYLWDLLNEYGATTPKMFTEADYVPFLSDPGCFEYQHTLTLPEQAMIVMPFAQVEPLAEQLFY